MSDSVLPVPLRLIAVCAPLALTGCVIGFDTAALSNGRKEDGGTATGGNPAAGDMLTAPAPVADLGTSSLCFDFSTYSAGDAIPDWTDGRGTWRIMDMPAGHALGQTDASNSFGDRFVTWNGTHDWADATVSTVARLADQTNENCVVTRLQDASNFYALCLTNGLSFNSPGPAWRLKRVVDDFERTLASGSIDGSAAPHTLTLRAQGSTLTPSIDGATYGSFHDSTFVHGAMGLGTDVAGVFTLMCMGRL